MGNPKIAIVVYCLAVGFILAVAFHSRSNTQVAANVVPVQNAIFRVCNNRSRCPLLLGRRIQSRHHFGWRNQPGTIAHSQLWALTPFNRPAEKISGIIRLA
jgi:hypothetical protein